MHRLETPCLLYRHMTSIQGFTPTTIAENKSNGRRIVSVNAVRVEGSLHLPSFPWHFPRFSTRVTNVISGQNAADRQGVRSPFGQPILHRLPPFLAAGFQVELGSSICQSQSVVATFPASPLPFARRRLIADSGVRRGEEGEFESLGTLLLPPSSHSKFADR